MAGVTFNPITNEHFWAEKGRGAFLNDKRLRVAARRDMAETVLATGIPFLGVAGHAVFLKELHQIAQRVSGVRRFGSAALDLAFVAAGRFDGYWERGLSRWDMAAGVLLVAEAGGVVSDADEARSAEQPQRRLRRQRPSARARAGAPQSRGLSAFGLPDRRVQAAHLDLRHHPHRDACVPGRAFHRRAVTGQEDAAPTLARVGEGIRQHAGIERPVAALGDIAAAERRGWRWSASADRWAARRWPRLPLPPRVACRNRPFSACTAPASNIGRHSGRADVQRHGRALRPSARGSRRRGPTSASPSASCAANANAMAAPIVAEQRATAAGGDRPGPARRGSSAPLRRRKRPRRRPATEALCGLAQRNAARLQFAMAVQKATPGAAARANASPVTLETSRL